MLERTARHMGAILKRRAASHIPDTWGRVAGSTCDLA